MKRKPAKPLTPCHGRSGESGGFGCFDRKARKAMPRHSGAAMFPQDHPEGIEVPHVAEPPPFAVASVVHMVHTDGDPKDAKHSASKFREHAVTSLMDPILFGCDKPRREATRN